MKKSVNLVNVKIVEDRIANIEILYKTNNDVLINADVNGACNIIRKYTCKFASNLSDTVVSGVINHTVRIYPTKTNKLVVY